MLRRDYIIDQIEELGALLAKILGFAATGKWENARAAASQGFEELAGMDAARALEIPETELCARVLDNSPTQLAAVKIFMLAALFKSMGDILAGEGQDEASQRHYLKGLHLLLGEPAFSSISARPDFVPTVDAFLVALGPLALPAETHVLLMRHFEQTGQFAKAEDELFAVADNTPPGAELLKFGESFYQRLARQSDTALLEGNLSREEARSGLGDFRARMKMTERNG